MSLVNTTDATEADLEVLRDQLGRVPRGVVGIAAPPGRRQGCLDA